eukprot:10275060-Alexandrium_andersonii.AAC.1
MSASAKSWTSGTVWRRSSPSLVLTFRTQVEGPSASPRSWRSAVARGRARRGGRACALARLAA